MVSPLEVEVEKLLPAAKALVDTNGADQDNPLKAMAQSEKELEQSLEAAVKATEKIKTDLDKIKNCSSKGPFAEARSSLIKIKVKVGAIEQKCKKTDCILAGSAQVRSTGGTESCHASTPGTCTSKADYC